MAMAGHPFSAQLLRASADGLAGIAASRLFEADPTLAERHGEGAFQAWRRHLGAQLGELAAAAADGVPEAFAERVAWSREAFAARDVPVADLSAGLECLRGVLREELPPAAWQPLDEYLDRGRARIHAEARTAGTELDRSSAEGELAHRYLTRLFAGEVAEARELVLAAVGAGMEVRTSLVRILVPALQEVGRLWHLNEIGVAEEHLATSATRRLMARLVDEAEPGPRYPRTVLVAAAAGDAHEVAPELVSNLFHLDGWRALGLGADVPPADLVLAVERFAVDLVALSATLDVQRDAVAETIRRLRAGPRDVPVLVGGGAFAVDDALWRGVGADGFARAAEDAPRLGRELLEKG